MAILFQMLFFLVVGVLMPLLQRNDRERCQPLLPIEVYACYIAFMFFSGALEIRIYKILSAILYPNDLQNAKCNSYLIAKGIQGQLANLSTFVHIGFCAHIIACNKNHAHSLEEELEGIRDND